MRTREIPIQTLTPAFLGNAEQSGQWRTPPIKALLRQWWRVAFAARHNFVVEVSDLRQAEGMLFGHVFPGSAGSGAHRSLVRIRLEEWREGRLREWSPLPTLTHPEVRDKNGNVVAIGSDLYLGYGPLTLPHGERSPKLKAHAALQAGESNVLSIAYPEGDAPLLEQALGLIDRYGTIGGRSRNGWGSLALSMDVQTPLAIPLRDWKTALQLDWAHCIGKDAKGPLIWQTDHHKDWKTLIQELARLKIGLRTQFAFHSGKGAPRPEDRHWLSYPVTKHSVQPWKSSRLPNTLRFKVRQAEGGGLVGVLFHMPHQPPVPFLSDPKTKDQDLETIQRVWGRVHQFLDHEQKLKRIGE